MLLELDLVDVQDVRWPLGRLAVRERRPLGLSLPRVVDTPFDPFAARTEPLSERGSQPKSGGCLVPKHDVLEPRPAPR